MVKENSGERGGLLKEDKDRRKAGKDRGSRSVKPNKPHFHKGQGAKEDQAEWKCKLIVQGSWRKDRDPAPDGKRGGGAENEWSELTKSNERGVRGPRSYNAVCAGRRSRNTGVQ